MAGEIRARRIPCTREIAPELRRKRLLAARRFAIGSLPRLAIMLGHWDRGSIVLEAGQPLKKRRRKRRGDQE